MIFRKRKQKKNFDGKININLKKVYITVVLAASLILLLALYDAPEVNPKGEFGRIRVPEISDLIGDRESAGEDMGADASETENEEGTPSEAEPIDILSLVPDYSEVGRPAYALNDNKPWFTEEEYVRAESKYIQLSELDYLGRCGTCEASLGEDTLAGERDFTLDHVKPSGWKQAKYEDLVDNGGWLYNRCHLIMYAVSGLTDDPRNLITGTRYLNDQGMLSYSERATQNYIIRKAGGGRILYRATPIFKGLESVCRGVHIQAGDVETRGEKFHINVYCYNVQPGIGIDYFTGTNWRE